MKLSTRWLDELLQHGGGLGLGDRSPSEIARLLTFHTAAVDSVTAIGSGLDGVVTGRVTAVRPHPNADRLRLCTVDTGAGAPQEVVCGAPNVAEGQVVCFAREGLTLPNGVKLKRAKIRGVESAGMICSEDELGLGSDHSGIIVCPAETPIGTPAAQALQVADTILEVENPDLTHRPDLWGHVGFARELGTLLDARFAPPSTPTADAALEAATEAPFPIEIEDPDGCRRYVGIVIEGVKNGPSPRWLRYRLEALGVRSIDLLVDLTNLVMLEQGQPLHAFDLRFLQGDRIGVRRARDGEKITTLDGETRSLVADDLLIVDGERPVAIAGVMGGENSEVKADTTAVLLEAANFDAVRIRRTAARLGLRTEASTRFEKALDPASAETAARRFTELLLRLSPGARVARRLGDAYPRPYAPVTVRLPFDLISRRLGKRISELEVRASLQALGFGLTETNAGLDVHVPSWRATKDVSCPEDLVEEVGRVHGYGDIPPMPPIGCLTPTLPPPMRRLERRLAAVLSLDLGYAETRSYPFYGANEAKRLGLEDVPHLALRDPVSEDLDRLAQTAVVGLLRAASRNVARVPAGRIWDATRLIMPRSGAAGLPTEVRTIATLVWERDLDEDPEGLVFRGLVQDLRSVLTAAPAADLRVRDGADEVIAEGLPSPVWLHPGRRAVFEAGGRIVCVAGEVAPAVVRAFGLRGRFAVGEVNLERVLASLDDAATGYVPLHRFPVVPFDVAVIVPRKTPAAEVADTIAGVSRERIRAVALFDVYEGKGIPEGHRSLAFTCELLDPTGTLDARKADKIRVRIRRALEERAWTVRAGD